MTPSVNSSLSIDNGSFPLIKLFGVPIRIHWSFFLLLLWVILTGTHHIDQSLMYRVAFVICLFLSICIHELAHTISAIKLGAIIKEVVLYPIGGIARHQVGLTFREELFVASSGPLSSLFLAVVAWTSKSQMHSPFQTDLTSVTGLLNSLYLANIALALFNLVPAYPMDGGRILHSLLHSQYTAELAAKYSLRITQTIAFGFGLASIAFGQLGLLMIAFLLLFTAGSASQVSSTLQLSAPHLVRDAMMNDFKTLSLDATVREAATLLLSGSQQDFPVVNDGRVEGVLSRSAILRGVASAGHDTYVAGLMDRNLHVFNEDDALGTLLESLRDANGSPAMVMSAGEVGSRKLIGIVTQENLLEFLALQEISSGK